MKDYKKLCIICITLFASIFLISESLKNIYKGYTETRKYNGQEYVAFYVLNSITGKVQLYSNNTKSTMLDNERNAID